MVATFLLVPSGQGAFLGQDAMSAFAPHRSTAVEDVEEALDRLPLRFEENLGQAHERAHYLVRTSDYTAFFTPTEVVFSLEGAEGEAAGVVRLRPLGAESRPALAAGDRLPGVANYLIGRDSSRWVRGAPSYSSVTYERVWEGVDLRFYEASSGGLEYDALVAPGADPSRARFEIEGATELEIRDGALRIETASGPLTFKAPHAFQVIDGEERAVRADFALEGSKFGFVVGDHDPAHLLVIDPEVVGASTYLGGNAADAGNGIAIDANGRPVIVGRTASADFPVCAAAGTPTGCEAEGFQSSRSGSSSDAFLTILSRDLSTLVASTYLGGTSLDEANDVAIDTSGRVLIAGRTTSFNLPVCTAPGTPAGCEAEGFQTSIGASSDAFLAVLSPDLSTLVGSTYLGGSGAETGSGIAVHAAGRPHVAGDTASANFPVCTGVGVPAGCTAAGAQTIHGGDADVFLAVLSSDLSALVGSTYLGGTNADVASGIAIDNDRSYVTGNTDSTDLPVCTDVDTPTGCAAAGLQTASGGATDAFVAGLSTDLGTLAASTYLGGTNGDQGFGIELDASGRPHVTGFTFSSNFPVCTAPDVPTGCVAEGAQTTHAGSSDLFATTLTSDLDAPAASTFLGGSGADIGRGIAFDATGRPNITGSTSSSDFPVCMAPGTPSDCVAAGAQTTSGGDNDAFHTVFELDLDGFVASTYHGGAAFDSGRAIAVDAADRAFITGETSSSDLPVCTGRGTPAGCVAPGIQTTHGGVMGDIDGFVTRFGGVACGDVVSGTVVLTESLGPCPGHGLIAGGNLNLNLNGFVLRGQGAGNGVLVPPGGDVDVAVVRNGSIRGFGNGVLTRATTVRLVDLAVQHNDARGALVIADRGVLVRVTATGNDAGGIFARVADGRLDIRSSRAVNNGGIGTRAVADVLVARNNLVRNSARHGLSGAATTRAVYTGNRLVRNGVHGLVNSAVPAAINGNVALNNTRLGIVAPDRPAVRGSNSARGNNADRPLQCRPRRLC